jgi:hypothetical protein
MKFLGLLTIICIYAIGANAQEINLDSIRGTWNYESPKAKTKLSYKFDFENKFTSITERKETETQINGAYAFDKVSDLNRLIITSSSKEDGTRTHTLYYFIKFIGTDTLKLQPVNDKEINWLRETKKNTMVFVRKKEKVKKL